MGMDAQIYKTSLKNVVDNIPYAEIEAGWTGNHIPHLELVLLLDIYGEKLQRWAEKNVKRCGYITLFMTDALVEEIKSVIDLELVPYWEERVEPLLKEKDVVLVVHFT